MPRSDEAQAFLYSVYLAVQEIPPGKVTTYGHIAKLIGRPQNPRQVGQALKHLPLSATDADGNVNHFHHLNVPWQRVVSAGGIIAVRDDPSGAARHAVVLRSEGIDVGTKPDGRLWVDLAAGVGWFPEYLPSEESEVLGGVGEES
ncbi:DNA binding methylated-DNA--cysteine S-methyltransferase [Ascodesmis nigricans]|uniref:DNA binding methylated-DNA--cysteine S-methyltransferase n=1 Tax=Ascodesmis nigricans TaxID=341454 RepID=A0A4S2MWA3_9PEZI|nr:DNA binding methylated-DNA--cysteine S-methyltransferase [Ascodesmis nigricans]